MKFIYFLVFGEYFCSKGVSFSDVGFTLIFRKNHQESYVRRPVIKLFVQDCVKSFCNTK